MVKSIFGLRPLLKLFFHEDPIERKKITLLASCFALVMGGYTLVKELKDFAFVNIVGLDALPAAKFYAIFVLIPLVFIYSRVVDLLKRHQLLYLFSLVFSLGGLLCAYFLGHPTIGLSNTDTGKFRIFGWLMYFFVEAYQPFMVSLIWSFANTVTTPRDVKDGYVLFTAFSKLGGMGTALFAWIFLTMQEAQCSFCSDVATFQVLMMVSSLMLLLVPLIIMRFMRVIPHSHLHGYEEAYRFEKEREKKTRGEKGLWASIKGMFSGLYILVRYPYALGIFSTVFFWEVVNVSFNFLRLGVGKETSKNIAEFGVFLYQQIFYVHLIGLAIVLIGTKTFVTLLGERRSLIAVPLLTGLIIASYLLAGGLVSIGVAYILMRAINYAFAVPLRESLFIPTTKAMKFKSKSWIDGFGAKMAKCFGSGYGAFVVNVPRYAVFNIHLVFFGGIVTCWALVANALGKRFEKAVKHGEVIGAQE